MTQYTCNSCETLHDEVNGERFCLEKNPYNFGPIKPILSVIDALRKAVNSIFEGLAWINPSSKA